MAIKDLAVFAHGEFAMASLEALRQSHSVVLVVAGLRQPEEEEPLTHDVPPQTWARKQKIEVLNRGVAQDRIQSRVEELAPDAIVTVAWDRDLPASLLEVPKHGAVGLHASLLPRYRGGDPIRAALSAGESKTGVTTYLWKGELDAGPIHLQEEVEIGDEETYGELMPRMAALGAELLQKTLAELAKKGRKLPVKAQKEENASKAPRVTKRHRKAPWVMGAKTVFDCLRAYGPDPGLSIFFRGRHVDVLTGVPLGWVNPVEARPGTYMGLRQGRIAIVCGDRTAFGISRLRIEGEKPMGASRFVRTYQMEVGDRFI